MWSFCSYHSCCAVFQSIIFRNLNLYVFYRSAVSFFLTVMVLSLSRLSALLYLLLLSSLCYLFLYPCDFHFTAPYNRRGVVSTDCNKITHRSRTNLPLLWRINKCERPGLNTADKSITIRTFSTTETMSGFFPSKKVAGVASVGMGRCAPLAGELYSTVRVRLSQTSREGIFRNINSMGLYRVYR